MTNERANESMMYPQEVARASRQRGNGPAAPLHPTISSALDDFIPPFDRLQTYIDRLESVHGKLFGPLVEKLPPPVDTPGDTIINAMHVARSRLVSMLDRFEVVLQSLEGGI